SHATGRGFGFGLHGFFDQLGAVLGPLLVSAVLYYSASFKTSFLVLAIPAVLSLVFLWYAQKIFSEPESLDIEDPLPKETVLPKAFWLCVAGFSCIGCGYVDFALISFHFRKIELVGVDSLPIFYALGMAVVAFSSPFLGRLFDTR